MSDSIWWQHHLWVWHLKFASLLPSSQENKHPPWEIEDWCEIFHATFLKLESTCQDPVNPVGYVKTRFMCASNYSGNPASRCAADFNDQCNPTYSFSGCGRVVPCAPPQLQPGSRAARLSSYSAEDWMRTHTKQSQGAVFWIIHDEDVWFWCSSIATSTSWMENTTASGPATPFQALRISYACLTFQIVSRWCLVEIVPFVVAPTMKANPPSHIAPLTIQIPMDSWFIWSPNVVWSPVKWMCLWDM